MKFYKEKRDITRENGELYLQRWYILDTALFGLKLHKIVLSDQECVHDHPWDFISIILKGGYIEHVETPKELKNWCTKIEKTSKIYHPGQILFRKAEHRHKLEIHQPCWTFVITLKRRRKWGFWTKSGWIHWKLFSEKQNCE